MKKQTILLFVAGGDVLRPFTKKTDSLFQAVKQFFFASLAQHRLTALH